MRKNDSFMQNAGLVTIATIVAVIIAAMAKPETNYVFFAIMFIASMLLMILEEKSEPNISLLALGICLAIAVVAGAVLALGNAPDVVAMVLTVVTLFALSCAIGCAFAWAIAQVSRMIERRQAAALTTDDWY